MDYSPSTLSQWLRERLRRPINATVIFYFRQMFLVFQQLTVCAALVIIFILEPSLLISDQRYLNYLTTLSSWPSTYLTWKLSLIVRSFFFSINLHNISGRFLSMFFPSQTIYVVYKAKVLWPMMLTLPCYSRVSLKWCVEPLSYGVLEYYCVACLVDTHLLV